jgi:hypothetical protein
VTGAGGVSDVYRRSDNNRGHDRRHDERRGSPREYSRQRQAEDDERREEETLRHELDRMKPSELLKVPYLQPSSRLHALHASCAYTRTPGVRARA